MVKGRVELQSTTLYAFMAHCFSSAITLTPIEVAGPVVATRYRAAAAATAADYSSSSYTFNTSKDFPAQLSNNGRNLRRSVAMIRILCERPSRLRLCLLQAFQQM
jgi:hypothetical protein